MFENLKLLILDIDGVMTDGTKMYDTNGDVVSKRYCDKDFTAIKYFKHYGIHVCFISGDNRVNKAMAKKRGVDFYYTRENPTQPAGKEEILEDILFDLVLEPHECLYVGDDIYDLDIVTHILTHDGFVACPSDASFAVRELADIILPANGGSGVVMELLELYCNEKNITVRQHFR